jgi:hypothetical protein
MGIRLVVHFALLEVHLVTADCFLAFDLSCHNLLFLATLLRWTRWSWLDDVLGAWSSRRTNLLRNSWLATMAMAVACGFTIQLLARDLTVHGPFRHTTLVGLAFH